MSALNHLKYKNNVLARFYKMTRGRLPGLDWEIDGELYRSFSYDAAMSHLWITKDTFEPFIKQLQKDGVVKVITHNTVSRTNAKRIVILKELNNRKSTPQDKDNLFNMLFLSDTELAHAIRVCNYGKDYITLDDIRDSTGVKHIDTVKRIAATLVEANVIDFKDEGYYIKTPLT